MSNQHQEKNAEKKYFQRLQKRAVTAGLAVLAMGAILEIIFPRPDNLCIRIALAGALLACFGGLLSIFIGEE